jgi:Rad3-related DNA helicase
MTVVNQTIGRAIRSRSDYAAIVLCDRRFGRPRTVEKLPKFIRQSLTLAGKFADVQNCVESFFGSRDGASS